MRKFSLFFSVLGLGLVLFTTSCTKEDDTVEPEETVTTISASQASLDAVTTFVKDFTGGSFAHGGPAGLTGDQTIRKVYSSETVGTEVAVGTFITKRTYALDTDGNKTDLYVVFGMLKREVGYDADHKDWEYMMMPASADIDYTVNPNGMLPPESEVTMRGKLDGCIGCHGSAAGDDYTYIND